MLTVESVASPMLVLEWPITMVGQQRAALQLTLLLHARSRLGAEQLPAVSISGCTMVWQAPAVSSVARVHAGAAAAAGAARRLAVVVLR